MFVGAVSLFCLGANARLMALAIECDQLISGGMIKNQSELAHYAQVTTARMTHIMWLTNLAPEIHSLYSVM